MECDSCREALSARLDGEDMGVAPAVLDEHLARCGHCRALADQAVGLNRALRLRRAEPVPDLTPSILSVIAADRRARPAARVAAAATATAAEAPGILRLTLALVGAAQVLIAVPALLGNDLGAPVHVAHEQGAWALALAAGLAWGAVRPGRAGALVPIVGVFVGAMTVLGSADIASGRVVPSAELPHLMSLLGLVLLWLVSRAPVAARRAPAAARHVAV